MTFRFSFEADDMASWLCYYMSTSPSTRNNRLHYTFIWFLIPATIAGSFIYYFPSPKAFALGAAATAIFTFVGWHGYQRTIESQLHKRARDPHLQQGYGLVEVTLSEDGIREVTPKVNVLMKWAGVTDVIREPEYIYIRHSAGTVIINRRSYSGPVPFEELPRVVEDFRRKYSA